MKNLNMTNRLTLGLLKALGYSTLVFSCTAETRDNSLRGTISRAEAEQLGTKIRDISVTQNSENLNDVKIIRYAILVESFKACDVKNVGVLLYKKPAGIVFAAELDKGLDNRYVFSINREYKDGVIISVNCTSSKRYTFRM